MSAPRRTTAVASIVSAMLIATLLFISPQSAQAVSGVVNTYQVANVVGGTPDTSVLSSADCALVVQMTGTVASGLGTYEILDPATSAPTRTYSNSDVVQFVVLPGGCGLTQTVDAGGVQAQAWNGSTGGVVFLGGTTLTMNGNVDATGIGYSQGLAPSTNAAEGGDGILTQDPTRGFPQTVFTGAGGGGGILGGGGGGGSANYTSFNSNNGAPGVGGGLAAGGAGGVTSGVWAAGDGGDPGAPGNGGSSAPLVIGANVNKVGAGGAGGGSYGGGGGSCGSHFSTAYSAGGGGGASWTGGGPGGLGGTSTGPPIDLADGTPGADNFGAAIPLEGAVSGEHYLHDDDPRLMMGGAGGHHRNNAGGGNGGGIVVLSFDAITGNSNRVISNGGSGAPNLNAPASGAGGGAGGQIYIRGYSISGLDVSANGGAGGNNTVGPTHSAVAGSGGGAGAIWFDGAGDDTSNTGGNDGATSAASPMAPSGFAAVTWQVAGGGPGITSSGVTLGGVTYTAIDWNTLYNAAGNNSIANNTTHLAELSLLTGASQAAIVAVFPAMEQVNNPKNAGVSCTASGGGNGLVRVSSVPPPTLDIEKSTNVLDSDVAPGQTYVVGAPVTWTYQVTLSGWGTVDNVTLTDSIVPPGDIECDLDGDNTYESTNALGPVDAPGTFLCRAVGTVIAGQYMNTGTVTGAFEGTPVDDSDSSHYVGEEPSITVEKQTNGAEADTDTLNDGTEFPASTSDGAANPAAIGSPVAWTFQVANNGDVPLTNVAITDATTTANDQNHAIVITCDWASSSDPATAALNLSVGEVVPCSASGTAGTGLHENTATVTGDAAGVQAADGSGNPLYDVAGNPVFTPNPDGTFAPINDADGNPISVDDADASGYNGQPPSISLVKTIVGTADDETAGVVEGQAVDWELLVANTGAGAISNIVVNDPVLAGLGVSISCPATTLAQGEAMTCTASSAAGAIDVVNTATVTGDPAGGGPPLTDDDTADYTVGVPAIEVAKTTCTDPIEVPGSCSDDPLIPIDDPLAWHYVITNSGQVTIVNVTLSDDVEAAADASDCDWANSSDAITPANVLAPGETVSCIQAGTAGIGAYANVASASGVPGVDDGTPSEDPAGDPLPPVTDDDSSNYFGVAQPTIEIEKNTNGFQADTGMGPLIDEGNPVVWTFVVTNPGNVDLADVVVTDTVTIDNGTTPDPAGVVCDWAGSSDGATPARNLSIGESVTCTAASTAELGQYANNSTVTGTPVADATTADPDAPVRLTDENGADLADATGADPSAYFGPNPSIDLEKDTNGNQADVQADQDSYSIDDAITWTFVVTNDGNTDLADVTLVDSVTVDNDTTPDPAGIVCDWAGSTDAATPARNLSVGESVTCTSSSTAEPGQYRNDADVTGTPVADAVSADPNSPTPLQRENGTDLDDVDDADPSHYFGNPAPSIDIEKDTNGNQADAIADQDNIAIDDPVTWTFVIVNDGNVDLADVILTDTVTTDNGTAADPAGVLCDWGSSSDAATPARNLSVGESVTCTSSSTAEAGQYANLADVVGTPVANAATADPDAPVVLLNEDGSPVADVTDDDPSHYFGLLLPEIDIEKDTNGFQADTGTGPMIFEGDLVTWTFAVTNTGNVALGSVVVADAVTTDNGTTPDPAGVVCDWANSSDVATAAGALSRGETVTCAASSTAELGQYTNNATVVGSPLANDGSPLLDENGVLVPDVSDEDPSAYFGPAASIDIEKDTNGNQADVQADQDVMAVGDAVTWNFVVANDGNVDLANVSVTDTVTTDNLTDPDPLGVQCDWANSSDPATPARNLSVGETVECFSASAARAGQYANIADVVGTPVADATTADPNAPVALQDQSGTDLANVVDDDPSHYFAQAAPSIDIEKDTNGNQADTLAAQDTLALGAAVTWTFVVVNDGDVDLADVVVNDSVTIDNGTAVDPAGVVCDWAGSTNAATPARNLSVGESVSCASSSTAEAGQYRNLADVVGTPVADAVSADPDAPIVLLNEDGSPVANVTDDDPSHYYGAVQPGIAIEKDTNGVQADGRGTEPVVFAGDPVTWTFQVTNTGNITLGSVTINDVVTTDNGTVADPAGVVCDWANSSDAVTAAGTLSPGETVTCAASSVAQAGLYRNNATVAGLALANDGSPLLGDNGLPLPSATDEDPSGYFGPNASIDIEKDTNSNQADTLGSQDTYPVGDLIGWTFVVTNDGNVDLANVVVNDSVTIDNGTAADPAGVVCDWVGSTDAATPARNLSVGESVVCAASSMAEAGQYRNDADVTATPVADAATADPDAAVPLTDQNGIDLVDVDDADPSHYFGQAAPSIDIEKDTNGNQADAQADQDIIPIDAPITWTFVVTNDGDVDLADVVVTDVVTIDNGTVADPAGVVCDWAGSTDAATPDRNLSVGEVVTCSATSTAAAGQYANDADVSATPVADATTADPDAPVALRDVAGDDLADVTDDDPSHYYGDAIPGITIEKDTNGSQADTGTGPMIFEGDPVLWTFVVTNVGASALGDVAVSDAITTDNGTAADPAGVVCDWAASSDAATPAGTLARGETVTCTAASTAELGQHANNASVVGSPLANDGSPLLGEDGEPLADVTNDDRSAYFGPSPSIDIEKDTNGNQADALGDQDIYSVGDPVTWTFVVTNDGNTDLANVVVTDVVTIDNGTVADPARVVCDWADSTDAATPARNLSVGESVTCTSASIAEAGQYRNDSGVTATPVADAANADPDGPTPLKDENGVDLADVDDADPSHYYAQPQPSIDIEKDTNSNQADVLADQDIIALGAPVTWTFVVTNDGDVDLADVVVTDVVTTDNGTTADPAGVVCNWANSSDVATPARNLSIDESVTCAASSIAEPGQYANMADVVGTPVANAVTADPDAPIALLNEDGSTVADVTDDDPSHYYGLAQPAIQIEKDTNGVQADLAGSEPVIFLGDLVTWTFQVENEGNVALGDVTITDAVTTDNGTADDPAGVVCDWANSSDPDTAAGVLSPNEIVLCSASSIAEPGVYRNNATVVGTPLANDGAPLLGDDGLAVADVVDDDPSGYFGPEPSIDIEKDTNANQSDTVGAQDVISIDSPVVWTFVVVNDGNTDLAAVVVSDVVTVDNGTATDPNGVVCDWGGSTDPATPAGNLSVGETVTCTSNSLAEAGQYRNDADVVGTPVADAATADPDTPIALSDLNGTPLPDVIDDDPSHYYGDPQPSIDIEKDTNGNQADTQLDQDIIPIDAPVTWTFVVTNDGNVDLADVVVVDVVTIDNGTAADPAGVVCDWAGSTDAATPARNLSVGETVTCTSVSTAAAGQYANDGDVTATPVADAAAADPDAPVALRDLAGDDLADVTDVDPSHYYGDAIPGITIEKDTNGFQADTGTGPLVFAGNDVTWTFVVTNIGTSTLGDVAVSDVVTTDNGTVVDPAGVVCDWTTSSDPATPADTLARGETVTCAAASTAELGQYTNNANVVGSPLANDGTPLLDDDGLPVADVVDEDPSAYFGPNASIDIEKDTNGTQADVLAQQDVLAIGAPVTWTFVVVNDGNVDLADVIVTDVVTIDNGTPLDPNGVVCDWANSSDAATPARNLSVGETVTCASASVTEPGQYGNLSDVVATPVADARIADPDAPTPLADENGIDLAEVTDSDPSHYYGAPQPSIDIEKDTNSNQADVVGDQDTLAIGAPVTWTFVVVNDGNVDLADVIVADVVTMDNGTAADPAGVVCDWANSSDVATPARNLSVGETVTCSANSLTQAGQYGNIADVVGTPVADAVAADPDAPVVLRDVDGNELSDVTDADRSHYYGDAIPGIDIEKDTNGVQADTGTGPLVFAGSDVTWTFVVSNTGTSTLGDVVVTDAVTTDNGTAVDPVGVVCDWANSSDPATAATVLSPLETVTCSASSDAALGQYRNVAEVVASPLAADGTPLLDADGTPMADVVDDDPSAYFGPNASIDIEKDTNGNQADLVVQQDTYGIGDSLLWTFVVTNDGNVDLANVTIADAVTIDNGTPVNPAGLICDWSASSDSATPPRNLSVDETVTCTASGLAAAGQYANLSSVVGTPVADAATADPFAPLSLQDQDGQDLARPSDTDPSHYFGQADPSIDIEKYTNGDQADTISAQHNLAEGDPVTWTFVVTNTGDVDLAGVQVNDVVTIYNATAADPDGVVCDWDASSDDSTPAQTLSVGETVTCSASSIAQLGQHRNDSTAVATPVANATTADPVNPAPLTEADGTPLPEVTDDDPSHYFGAQSAIVVEKHTNANSADTPADQDNIAAGDPVVWTFVVTNTGSVDLADVVVTDVVTIDNGTVLDPNGVVCDWANSSDAATPARNLAVDETVTCTSASTAAAGQYANNGVVSAQPVEDATTADPDDVAPMIGPDGQPIPPATDEDTSSYLGVDASIDIEKYTNGNQADAPADQDVLPVGSPVTWSFEVINDGNVDLARVVVTDAVTIDNGTAVDPNGVVCDWFTSSDSLTPAGQLSVGETVTCTSSSTAAVGQHANVATASGVPVDDATSGNPVVLVDASGLALEDITDDDASHYFGGAIAELTMNKSTNGNQASALATQGNVVAGDPITWTFEIVNSGDVDVVDVIVTDEVLIDNGAETPNTPVCDWENSSDAATPIFALSVGESAMCFTTSTAAPGQYANLGSVVATPAIDASVADPAPVLDGGGEPLPPTSAQDRSYHFGAAPSVRVDKSTNGVAAERIDDQPDVNVGDPLTWTFVITNDGNMDLGDVTLTDDVVIDNGSPAGPIACDWDASTDRATPGGNLAVGESVVCRSTGIAAPGQHANLAEVMATPVVDATDGDPTPALADGEPLPPVGDDDTSHYFGRSNPSVIVDKSTNGVQADTIADQGGVEIGADLIWTYVITNDGDADIADISLRDSVTIDNGTVHDPAGPTCAWAQSTDRATPVGALSVGESVTCTLSGTAGAGQYGNLAEVSGTPVRSATNPIPERLVGPDGAPLPAAEDSDPSHVFAGFFPAVEVEKSSNGTDADTVETSPYIDPNSDIVWTFVVRNTGNVDLAGVSVTDTVIIDNGTVTPPVTCDWSSSTDTATPAGNLSAGETVTCTSSSTTASGQYGNRASVAATPVLDAASADPAAPLALLDADGNPVPAINADDVSYYFGPVFDLALRKQLEDGTNLGEVEVGDEVTFTITLFNQGNVPASEIEVVDYFPPNLRLSDPAWTSANGGAVIRLDGVTLDPGDSTTVDITVTVVTAPDGGEVDVEAEIFEAVGVDTEGDPIELISASGEPLELLDVDSTPDDTNDETAIEDEIDNADGDEDDHDRVGLIIETEPVVVDPVAPAPVVSSPGVVPEPLPRGYGNPPVTQPPQAPERPSGPLAFTGASSSHLAAIAALLFMTGGALVLLGRDRREDEDELHI